MLGSCPAATIESHARLPSGRAALARGHWPRPGWWQPPTTVHSVSAVSGCARRYPGVNLARIGDDAAQILQDRKRLRSEVRDRHATDDGSPFSRLILWHPLGRRRTLPGRLAGTDNLYSGGLSGPSTLGFHFWLLFMPNPMHGSARRLDQKTTVAVGFSAHASITPRAGFPI
jgi:hypothetical protein